MPALLGDGNLFRVTVDGGSRGKYHATHARLHERAHERDPLRDIVLKILGWIGDRFSHFDQAGEMDAGLQVVLAGDACQEGAVTNFPVIERRIIVQQGAVAASQIIQHHDLFSFCSQAFHRHAADVACPTRYKDRHSSLAFYVPSSVPHANSFARGTATEISHPSN